MATTGNSMSRKELPQWIVISLVCWVGCSQAERPSADVSSGTGESSALAVGKGPQDLPGVHNIIRLSEKLLSGGVPEGDEGFDSLKKLGVETIISVDGARPDVDRAKKFGQRYVHLPIGYDGVPREQALRIARAVRDLPGQVFIHCHHGKHRSPAAAIAAHLCLDDTCTAEKALAFLKQAGTGANYSGLYAATEQFTAISKQELDNVSAEFPEVTQPDDFIDLMGQVERHLDHLKRTQAAGWKSPARHPDLDPPHEALLLREAYEELARLPESKHTSAEMHRWLSAAAADAQKLEDALRSAKDHKSLQSAFAACTNACAQCHRKYRDVPQK
jgi:protein-tyrosine phosphatase